MRKKLAKGSKTELKKQINETLKLINENSKDAKYADELTKKLLSLKGQYDIEPMRMYIPEKDIVKEYDFDSSRFLRCRDCIVYQVKGGATLVVDPRMTCLYNHLENLLDLKDNYNDSSDELKKVYETLYSATVHILNLPIYAPSNDKLFFGIAGDILTRLDAFISEELEKPLQDETPKENAEFENKTKLTNQVLDELEEDAKK